ncbi:MAG TPA: phage holin family protein [Solirubrobacterales bacterium]
MSPPGANGSDLREHSTGDLVKQLADQTSNLVRQEIELAKSELSAKGKVAGEGAGMFGGAAIVALLALGTLTALVLSLLDKAMDFTLAALIVTLVYTAIATVLALGGRTRLKKGMPPAPEQTIETVKEDVQWAKSQAKSVRR